MSAPPAPTPALLPPVILIVDDDPAIIQIMAAALQPDYEICFARNGEDALRVARQTMPVLILLDVMMPGLDGYEVCRRLKRDAVLADVPVIFTTALNAAEDELRGLSVGAIDYVTKPIQPLLLRRRVDNHVATKRLRDQLADQALTDPLTGLGNRRLLESRMPQEIRRLSRELGWLSFVMLDIDCFKQFNDTYGHPAGDVCLQQVARVLAAGLDRAADLAVRHGGEEFVCLLPGTDASGARMVAENMRRQIETLAIPHASSVASGVVTVSLGIASARCDWNLPETFWESEADKMLYRSKAGGRNRVSAMVAEPQSHAAAPTASLLPARRGRAAGR